VSEPKGTLPETRDRLLARIADVRRAELDRAVTLVGPHRDDLFIELNGLPARGYASHGESWSLALSLRLASAELLRDTGAAGDPVVILDDVFAELDEGRRGRLLEAVVGFEQVIVTAAVAGDVPDLDAARVIRIRAGEVVDD
jgi:DNA replication and repair protein RecF